MTTVGNLISEKSDEELSKTDKQMRILEIAEDHMEDTPADLSKVLDEELGDDAPSQAYVYNVLRRSSPQDFEEEEQEEEQEQEPPAPAAPAKIVKRIAVTQTEDGEIDVELEDET